MILIYKKMIIPNLLSFLSRCSFAIISRQKVNIVTLAKYSNMCLLLISLQRALSELSRVFSNGGAIISVDFLGVGTVVKALALMGSATLLVGVVTVPLFCDSLGLFSSLDDVDKEGEFEFWNPAAAATSKNQAVQYCLIYGQYYNSIHGDCKVKRILLLVAMMRAKPS